MNSYAKNTLLIEKDESLAILENSLTHSKSKDRHKLIAEKLYMSLSPSRQGLQKTLPAI